MAGLINRLWVRVTLVVLLVLALLLPPLYFALVLIDEQSHVDSFIDDVRLQGRMLADEFELGNSLDSRERTQALLDSVLLSGFGVYAEIDGPDGSNRSSLVAASHPGFPGDDFEFGSRGDGVYYLSLPVHRADRTYTLRLGFDETQAWQEMQRTRSRVLVALGTFAATALALVLWLVSRIAKPLGHLQLLASRIAGGNYDEQLRSGSSIHEMREFEAHLESMRIELVGVNARLSREMVELATSEAQRRGLEEHLRQRERVATVGTMAGGIAHEFNNILTPILLYSQTALDTLPADDVAADDLRRVVASAHRARALIGRVLTFSREIETGPLALVAVGPVVDETVELLRAIVPPNVDIVARTAGAVPEVVGEPGLLHQLVMNLCTNAYQAMRASGGRMTIGLELRHEAADDRVEPGDYVVLSVADTGHGMDKATMNRIFEPFFTTREIGEGTGLGLSVAHGIAASVGATIVVDSAPGAGSEFRVYFPVPADPRLAPAMEVTHADGIDH